MMKILLALETASPVVSVALVSEETILAEETLNVGLTHAEVLMEMVGRLMARARLSLKTLAGIAVSAGPGSFTGLRIGAATAKTLAYASRKPLYAVPTLLARAAGALPAGLAGPLPICPLLNARRQEFYAALYRFPEGRWQSFEEMEPPQTATAEALRDWFTGPTLVVGEGVPVLLQALGPAPPPALRALPEAFSLPRASLVGLLALAHPLRFQVEDLFLFEPTYLRPAEVQLSWRDRTSPR